MNQAKLGLFILESTKHTYKLKNKNKRKVILKKILTSILCSTLLFAGHANAAPSDSEYKNALTMANLSARVYDNLWDKALDVIAPKVIPIIDFRGNTKDFTVEQAYTKDWGGFDAKLYYNSNDDSYVLAFRGTELFSISDWIVNASQLLNKWIKLDDAQYEKAAVLARNLKEDYGDKLQFTGHSLGGGLAQVAGLATGLKTTCFDAAGLTTTTIEKLDLDLNNSHLITHFNVQYDPLSDFDAKRNNKSPFSNTLQYGDTTYWLDNIFGTGGKANPLRIGNHFYHTFVYQLSRKDYY